MKRIGIEKIICIILICIILVEAIYIFICKKDDEKPRRIFCNEAYACKCGENNELEMCDCKYCENYDFENNKCLEEKYVQCRNSNWGDNNE